MASIKEIVPENTTICFAEKGDKKYVLLPLGDTFYTPPIVPTPDNVTNVTYSQEMEIEYDTNKVLKDATGKIFAEYIGGRPTR